MKFGKSLSSQIEETLPGWRDKFLSYKELKKRLNLIPTPQNNHNHKRRHTSQQQHVTHHETDFITFIEAEMEKFNAFFVDQEEDYIIRLKELQDGLVKAKESNQELIMVQKEIVDLHGEMVLLENYSTLNYTGLVKIIKKYEKRTGAPIRIPLIQNVLQQPFYTTDVIYKLVKQCEKMVGHLFPNPSDSAPIVGNERGLMLGTKELEEIEHMESMFLKSTVSALRVLQEIRSKSST